MLLIGWPGTRKRASNQSRSLLGLHPGRNNGVLGQVRRATGLRAPSLSLQIWASPRPPLIVGRRRQKPANDAAMDSYTQPSRGTRDWDEALQPGAFPGPTNPQFWGRIIETLQVVYLRVSDKFRASPSSLEADRLLIRDPIAFTIRPFVAV
jgi:hypothetical protein